MVKHSEINFKLEFKGLKPRLEKIRNYKRYHIVGKIVGTKFWQLSKKVALVNVISAASTLAAHMLHSAFVLVLQNLADIVLWKILLLMFFATSEGRSSSRGGGGSSGSGMHAPQLSRSGGSSDPIGHHTVIFLVCVLSQSQKFKTDSSLQQAFTC